MPHNARLSIQWDTPHGDIGPLMPILEEYASKAAVVIELGCGAGNGSTKALAAGLRRSPAPEKLLITVDIEAGRPYMHLRPELPAYWHKITGDSRDERIMHTAEVLMDSQPPMQAFADLIFIDTDHTAEQIACELSLWSWLACPKTVWLFHDTWMLGSYNPMTDAIKKFAKESSRWVYSDITRESHGLGLMVANNRYSKETY